MSIRDRAATDAPPSMPNPDGIAERFVAARLEGRSLDAFPGQVPDDLVAAYRVQDAAIARWPDRLVGWKVGFIGAERRDASGDERLLGPIFARHLSQSRGEVEIDIFDGGFGAVEAEYVLRLEADMPAGQDRWSPQQAEAFPASLHIGVEIASSPLATINGLGPRVVVSDFGNNNGLILGDEIPDWRAIPEARLTCRTLIEGAEVGRGGATTLPGGLRAAFAFALTRSAARGRRLRAGDLIATGNATGIHDISVGQRASVVFDGHGAIACRARAARPRGADGGAVERA